MGQAVLQLHAPLDGSGRHGIADEHEHERERADRLCEAGEGQVR